MRRQLAPLTLVAAAAWSVHAAGPAQTGFGANKPVLADPCEVCPWRAAGDVLKDALEPFGGA